MVGDTNNLVTVNVSYTCFCIMHHYVGKLLSDSHRQ